MLFYNFVILSIEKFVNCDWGDMDSEDCKVNDEALKNSDGNLHGSYPSKNHPDWKIWIITEWDRSVTTVLFPEYY